MMPTKVTLPYDCGCEIVLEEDADIELAITFNFCHDCGSDPRAKEAVIYLAESGKWDQMMVEGEA